MVSKNCSHCKQNKSKEDFYKSEKYTCKACLSSKRKKRYESIKNFVNEYKKSSGCKVCGYSDKTHPDSFVVQALEFHHTKKIDDLRVSNYVSRGFGLGIIKKEIDKCEVLCSRCHVEIHYK
jgi:hypothetical protein